MPRKATAVEPPFPAYSGAEGYVFVSYSHQDTEAVSNDLALLHAQGVRIWYDEGISPGSEWSDELAHALDGAALVLFYVSAAAVASRHCRDEINFAHNRDKRILPIYLEPIVLRGGLELSLSSTQAIPRHALAEGKYLAKLLEVLPSSVAGAAGAVAAHPAADLPGPRARRRRYTLAAAAALVLALGALAALNKDYLLSRLILYSAEYLGNPIEQHVGFAVTADGTRIAHASTGDGPPVLIVLGWGTHLQDGVSSPTYDPAGVLALSSEKHRIIRYDGRGFGLSDRNVKDFSLEARVSDIEAVVAALKLERFAMIGQSAGGPAAIAYASRHPDKLVSLTLAGAAANRTLVDARSAEAFRRMLDVVEASWESTPAAIDLFIATIFPGLQDGVEKEVAREFMRRAANGRDMAGFYRASRRDDVSRLAEQIRVPTVVVHAKDDRTISLARGRQLATLIPGARFVIIDGDHRESTGGTAESRKVILDLIDELARTEAASVGPRTVHAR